MKHTPHDPMDDDSAPEDFQDESNDDVVIDAMDGADGADDGERLPEAPAVLEVDELKKVLAAELSTDTTQHYLN